MTVNNPHMFKLPKVEITLGRMDWVVERCKGKKVLHLGCVDEGLKFLKAMGVNNLIQGDIERIGEGEDFKKQGFDIILASEIIEHLNNPGLFLQNVKRLFSANTEMIITVPNCFRLTGLRYKLKGYEFVHPDHNYWFSYKTLLTLISKNGYVVKEILVYSYSNYKMPSLRGLISKIESKIQRRQSAEAQGKLRFPRRGSNPVASVISAIKLASAVLFRKVLYRANPFLADGIIAIVRPKDYHQENVF